MSSKERSKVINVCTLLKKSNPMSITILFEKLVEFNCKLIVFDFEITYAGEVSTTISHGNEMKQIMIQHNYVP